MKNCLWLLLLALCCCLTVRSQQPGEVTSASDDSSKRITTSSNGAVFLNFTGAVREGSKVLLQWDVDSAEDGDFFVIQRSTDGVTFETIGALRKTGNNNHYELTDLLYITSVFVLLSFYNCSWIRWPNMHRTIFCVCNYSF